ncbi:NADAR family protein [Actinoallomurus sp. CA-142502]|uniref:NADAR family protein n=1 Tax=Actinoallomurus sp. CA-142502 TaxID=3239885 RepID=UPI003D9462B2
MQNRTFRIVDGERIEGTWRHVFIHNWTYHLTDLLIYADGAIWCWEWVDLDGLRTKLAQGWIATEIPPGARASAHDLASWVFDEPRVWIDPDDFVVQVADEIDRLNGRPDSTDRCLRVLDRYLAGRSDEDRRALATAYLAIPAMDRRYALGDMDAKDWPLRVLCTPVGDEAVGAPESPDRFGVVTEDMRRWAFDYFAEQDRSRAEYADRREPDDPPGPSAGPVNLEAVVYPKGWPDDPGVLVLRNEYPAEIEFGGVRHPTVTHAYWSLSTGDPDAAERIRTAERPYEARKIAEKAVRRPEWSGMRLGVMSALLRAKFAQHHDLADILIATGDAPIHYSDPGSVYWHARGERGRNWVGRLLELVRGELVAERAGLALR